MNRHTDTVLDADRHTETQTQYTQTHAHRHSHTDTDTQAQIRQTQKHDFQTYRLVETNTSEFSVALNQHICSPNTNTVRDTL